MQRCKRIGLDVTKRCNWRCQTCFYRWKSDFNADWHLSREDAKSLMVAGKARGCDHALLVGYGEPSLWPNLDGWVEDAADLLLTTSMITNGTMTADRALDLYRRGLNHLHVSVHGVGKTLDDIAGVCGDGASKRQDKLLSALKENRLPWRSNTTLQAMNYQAIPDIVQHCIYNGVRHYVFLGFLPHYEWGTRAGMVAVHPAQLRPYIESGLNMIEEYNSAADMPIYTTLRYHPFCHLDRKYWKYVVNARYVLWDPWEWDNGHAGESNESFWRSAAQLGDSVAVQGAPCAKCAVRLHCGGWNRTYAAVFGGADLRAINVDELPEPRALVTAGYFHDQNAANSAKGWF